MASPARKQERPPALPETVTVRDLGQKLPIGMLDANGRQLHKEFSLRPYTGRVDRHLAMWVSRNEGEHVARIVCKLLSLLVQRIGETPLELQEGGDSSADQELKVRNWFNADVLYLYLYARIAAVGEWMEMPYVCRVCGETGIAKVDLYSTEVRVIHNAKQLEQWITLKAGIPLRTGNTAKKLKLRPVKFSAQMMPESGDPGISEMGYGEFREAVCGVDCEAGHYTLTNDEIDEIPKLDMLAIERKAGQVAAGPDMVTNLKCPSSKCGAPIRSAFDWTYKHFFNTSVPLSALSD